VSITVPTAERTGTDPPRGPSASGWLRWVAAVAVVAIVAAVLVDDERSGAPSTAEPPGVNLPTSVASPTVEVSRVWNETFFPGAGVFTGVAASTSGVVAIGQHAMTDGAFVWAAGRADGAWQERAIERSAEAVVLDVAPALGGFVIAGALAQPGLGTSSPALWFGTADSDFAIFDQPFEGPGRVDAVRVIRGDLVVLGQASGAFADNLLPGTARFGRVLVGRPGSWEDVTPDGFSVVVTEMIGTGSGWLAVGADAAGAAIWWRAGPGAEWVDVRPDGLERGVITDVVAHPDGGFAAVARTWDSDGTPRSHLLRASGPRDWVAEGAPLRRDVGWIEPVSGGVIGGGLASIGAATDSTQLWTFAFGGSWDFVTVTDRSGPGRQPTTLRGFAAGMIAGGTAGQPTIWTDGTPPPTPEAIVTDRVWEAVGPLPGSDFGLVDTGSHLFATQPLINPRSVWISTDGSDWTRVEVDPSFVLAGFGETSDGPVIWGTSGSGGIVYDIADDGSRWAIRRLPGMTIGHVGDRAGTLLIFGTGPEGPVRLEYTRDGAGARSVPLEHLPSLMIEHGDLLIGAGYARPLDGLSLSGDRGESWVDIGVPVFTIGSSGGRLVVVTAETDQRILVLDEAALQVTELPRPSGLVFGSESGLRATIMTWADGVVARGPSVLRLLPDLTGTVEDVPLLPESGMNGVLLDLVPGPRGYAIVSEAGEAVLYRWVGGP